MWRHAVKSEHVRLYFAAESVLLHDHQPQSSKPLSDLRGALGTAAAPAAAENLLATAENCKPGLRARVEALAAACMRTGFDEMTAQQVVPRLWVGPLGPSESRAFLMEHSITHVLDATGGWRRRVSALENTWVQRPHPFADELQCLQLAAEDRPDFDLEPLLKPAIDFISSALASGSHAQVLVHCHSGISRSVALAAAYLIDQHQLTLRCAMRALCDARPVCKPNAGFERILQRHELLVRARSASQAHEARRALVEPASSSSSSCSARGTKRQLEEEEPGDELHAPPMQPLLPPADTASSAAAAPSAAAAAGSPSGAASAASAASASAASPMPVGEEVRGLSPAAALAKLQARLGSAATFPQGTLSEQPAHDYFWS